MSFGLEPIYTILQNEEKNNLIDIYLVPLDTQIETLKIASILRKNGFRVLIEMNNKKVSKCFEYAERENIKFISVIGTQEIETSSLRVKDMIKKQENEVKVTNLVDFLQKNIDN